MILYSVVNSVLEPRISYADPCGDLFKKSSVKRGIKQLFSIDILELTEQNLSKYEKEKIRKFKEFIVLKRMLLREAPLEDKIHLVPPNYSVALGVVDRVVKRLARSNQYHYCLEVFPEQERERRNNRGNRGPLEANTKNIFGYHCL